MLSLKPHHKPIRQYHALLQTVEGGKGGRITALRGAFRHLLETCCREMQYELVTAQMDKGSGFIVLNPSKLPVGAIRLLASDDHLKTLQDQVQHIGEAENLLLQSPRYAVLVRQGLVIMHVDLWDAPQFARIIHEYFAYIPPLVEQWESIRTTFSSRVRRAFRHFGGVLRNQKHNPAFERQFKQFTQLCKEALQSGLGVKDIEQMLVQHLLSAPLFTRLFKEESFAAQNAMAQEMEAVLQGIPEQELRRQEWSVHLQRFYEGIVQTYRVFPREWGQGFLESVYRSFFHPRQEEKRLSAPIPNAVRAFMVQVTDEILQVYARKSLGQTGVKILDPFMETGNFLVHVLRKISPQALPEKYQHDLLGNEIRLLPYYLATLSIEQEYTLLTDEALTFEGVCLVDSFGLGSTRQTRLFSPTNTERVIRQRDCKMDVVIGTPPNTLYEDEAGKLPVGLSALIRRIERTYALPAKDAEGWVQALRWATDRLGDEGVIAYFLPSGFYHKRRFANLRSYLLQEFEAIYVLEIGDMGWGENSEMSMAFFYLNRSKPGGQEAKLYYKMLPEFWDQGNVLQYLAQANSIWKVDWEQIRPLVSAEWPTQGLRQEYGSFMPIYTAGSEQGIFEKTFPDLGAIAQPLTVVGKSMARRVRSAPFMTELLAPEMLATQTQLNAIFPSTEAEKENRVLLLSAPSPKQELLVSVTHILPGVWQEGQYGLPFYRYDGQSTVLENISDGALMCFQTHYEDQGIHKWAVFHYIYAVLHHPDYRSRYAVNLQWDVPRIPFLDNFWRLVDIGKTLSGLHLYYDEIQPHRLRISEEVEVVESLKLNKTKTGLLVNKTSLIEPIPAAASLYKIGERSALDWVLGTYLARIQEKGYRQFSRSEQKRHFQQFLRLLGQVINVSLETLRLTEALPALDLSENLTDFSVSLLGS